MSNDFISPSIHASWHIYLIPKSCSFFYITLVSYIRQLLYWNWIKPSSKRMLICILVFQCSFQYITLFNLCLLFKKWDGRILNLHCTNSLHTEISWEEDAGEHPEDGNRYKCRNPGKSQGPVCSLLTSFYKKAKTVEKTWNCQLFKEIILVILSYINSFLKPISLSM